MSTKLFIYALWCLGVTGGFMVSGIYSYSPFADGGRSTVRGVGVGGVYGPTHK